MRSSRQLSGNTQLEPRRGCTLGRWMIGFSVFLAVTGGSCKVGSDGQPKVMLVTFREDGPPAVPNPAQADRDWKDPGYPPLAPSRDDGQPTFSVDWFDPKIPVWKTVFAPLAGKPGLRYLEVGVYEGRSYVWMFRNILTDPTCTGVGLDLFAHEGLAERFRENVRRAGLEQRTETLAGFSNEKLRAMKPNSFDAIYIDASHLANDVLRDAMLAWDLLKEGGILMFDDYRYTPHFPIELRPKMAIDSLITAFQKQLQVLYTGWMVAVQKIPDSCPGRCSRVGPYEFHWADSPPAGVLYDPRTKARVPLSEEENLLLQGVLAGRRFGMLGLFVPEDLVESPQFVGLRKKLGI